MALDEFGLFGLMVGAAEGAVAQLHGQCGAFGLMGATQGGQLVLGVGRKILIESVSAVAAVAAIAAAALTLLSVYRADQNAGEKEKGKKSCFHDGVALLL
jgi:hypothetical protein